MYLSRLEIRPEIARNAYEIHRQIWRVFPNQPSEVRRNQEEERNGFLFQVENHNVTESVPVLVQSRNVPTSDSRVHVLASREIHPSPRKNQRLAFVLTANPIKTIINNQAESKPAKKRAKCRVPLVREEEQQAWLARKMAEAAEVEVSTIVSQAPIYFRKGNTTGKIVPVTFSGIVRVKEPNQLVRLLEDGIGPAKTFGCGLLLVRSAG